MIGLIGCLLLLVGAYLAIEFFQAQQFVAAAEQARQAGDWERVAAVTRVWLERDPSSPTAILYAGEAAQHRGAFQQAADYFTRIPQDDALAPHALTQLGLLYLGPLNQPRLAEVTLKQAVELDPTTVEAQRQLIRYYGLTFQREPAVTAARAAILAGGDAPAIYVYLMAFDAILYKQGDAINRQWMLSDGDQRLFEVAAILHAARAIEESSAEGNLVQTEERRAQLARQLEILSSGLQRFPGNVELIAALLAQAVDRSDTAEVAGLLAQVPASAGNDARFWRYKGWLHQMRDERAEAEQAFRSAIERDRYDWRSRTQLAEVLRLQQRIEEAQSMLEVADVGHRLNSAILRLSNIEVLPVEVLEQLLLNAERVGDDAVAQRVMNRIRQIRVALVAPAAGEVQQP